VTEGPQNSLAVAGGTRDNSDMNAPFAWPGGKKNLKRTLLALVPPHDAYVEVFSGSAKLLFAKDPARWEVLNDLNGDLINFFRVVKHRAAELAERFQLECVHAARFRELRAAPSRASVRCRPWN
jgi:DNA adenine methylase